MPCFPFLAAAFHIALHIVFARAEKQGSPLADKAVAAVFMPLYLACAVYHGVGGFADGFGVLHLPDFVQHQQIIVAGKGGVAEA